MSDRSMVAHSRDTLPMKVADMTFLVNKLGEDCGPLQYVRELTQNSIDAILRLERAKGEVIWDVFWPYYLLDEKGVYKLACIDSGAGMTGEEMVRYINNLSSSIHLQSSQGNFGVGAKIAAAPNNPHGLVYLSWKDGIGYMIHLWLDPFEKVYGLKRFAQNNGEYWCYVEESLKPSQIKENGTVVILLGKDDDHNTIDPPEGTPMRSRWVLRYLNTRYFRFPEGVKVRAREGWELPQGDKHNFLREVEGQGVWLDKNSSEKGVVDLSGAKAHWWIIKSEADVDSGHTAPGGHMAALHKNELYEMVTGRAGLARLQGFGIIFGTARVVIYVEPIATDNVDLYSNTARTSLVLNGGALPWSEWAAEFRELMPDELIRLQEEIGARSGETDHKKAIHERLKQIRDLLRFSRFRPSPEGKVNIENASAGVGGAPGSGGGSPHERTQRSGGRAGRAGDIFSLFAQGGDANADAVDSFSEPERKWIRESDGTRNPPLLDDRAAKFDPEQNLLLINADFRAFTDMVDRWCVAYAHVPNPRKTVEDVVHEWFEQQLVEAVMSAMALRRTGGWSIQELEELWSEAALTAAVLPRWHIDVQIKRALGTKFGTLKVA